MELEDYIAALEAEGKLFAAGITSASADSAIPTCPDWVMRDLVHHQGEVHRWATAVVRDCVVKPSALANDFRGPLPSDLALLDWFVEGHARLVETLRSADADMSCFTFLADPPAPLTFWARRQTHETGIHRVDAESATGPITPFDPTIAADGIDEMLAGFAPRSRTPLHADPPVSLQVAPDDTGGVWTMTITSDAPRTVRSAVAADCTLTGAASDLFMTLWNRAELDTVSVEGDRAVIDLFRDNVKVRWG